MIPPVARINNVCPTVVTWTQTVRNNKGAMPSTNTVKIFDAFYKQLSWSSIVNKMRSVNCYAPDNISASITPLISVVGNTFYTNVGPFLNTDLTSDGLRGDGLTKALKTGVAPNVAFPNTGSQGLTLYISTGSAESKKDFGVNAGAYEPATILYPSYAGTCYWDSAYGSGTGRISVANPGSYVGYIAGNRTSAGYTAITVAKSSVAHTVLASETENGVGNLSANDIYVHAGNQDNVVNAPGSKRISFSGIHHGLTTYESKLFFNAIQTMRERLKGGWV